MAPFVPTSFDADNVVVDDYGSFLTASELSLYDERCHEIGAECLLTTFVLTGEKPRRGVGGKKKKEGEQRRRDDDGDGIVEDEREEEEQGDDDNDESSSNDEQEDTEEAAALRALGLPVSFGTTRPSFSGYSGGGKGKGKKKETNNLSSPSPHRYKTQLCRYFTSTSSPGACAQGGSCSFAHGEHELRRPAVTAEPSSPSSTSYRPPYHGPPPSSEPTPSKFYTRRGFLWGSRALYESGILMDDVGWYSVTPFELAKRHARRLLWSSPSPSRSGRREMRKKVVVDAFAGVGGDTAALVATGKAAVVAVDSCLDRLEAARHNAELVFRFLKGGDSDDEEGEEEEREEDDDTNQRRRRRCSHPSLCLDLIAADFFAVAPSLKADAVFMSPPWGGSGYSEPPVFDAATADFGGGRGIRGLLSAAREAHAPGAPLDVAVFLPRSTKLSDLVEAAGEFGVSLEVERVVFVSKKKETPTTTKAKKSKSKGSTKKDINDSVPNSNRKKKLVGITAYFGASARRKKES